MQTLLQQNHRLHQIMQKCEEQIMQLKKIGQDHQQQIDNLLKFNQRLLSIIQNQIPNKVLTRTSSGTNLHPIDETNQKEHDNVVLTHKFAQKGHLINDKVQHLEKDQIDRMGEENQHDQEVYKKHVNQPVGGRNNHKNNIDGKISLDSYGKFRNVDSYDMRLERPELSSGRNSTEYYNDNVIYREEKQSLIEIPKFLGLDKGLNEHYQKELLNSVEEFMPNRTVTNPLNNTPLLSNNNNNPLVQNLPPHNSTNNPNTIRSPPNLLLLPTRKQSTPSQYSQMQKISQAVTQRLHINSQELQQQFQTIHHLISQYKEDFDTEQYTHLCKIIKNDLQNDLKELVTINSQSLKFYQLKEKQLYRLKNSIVQFSPVNKLVQIIRKLNLSDGIEMFILNKVAPNFTSSFRHPISHSVIK